MTNETDRQLLLDLARRAIAAHVNRTPAPDPAHTGVFGRKGGAFVSLHTGKALRGCIGHIESDEPLGDVIIRCAVGASSHDPRFAPVKPAELPDLQIELSLLGAPEPIDGPSEIEIGRHGLIIEHGWHRGLLLPQVAIEWNWSADTFIAHTCQKAGLPADALENGAKLWRFEAEVFSGTHETAK